MPLYEYLCKKCGESFTLTMTISEHDKKRIQCPAARALKWSSKFSPFSRRHREKADDPLGRRGLPRDGFLLLLLAQFEPEPRFGVSILQEQKLARNDLFNAKAAIRVRQTGRGG
jgi:putative FmdB family regulatory protein